MVQITEITSGIAPGDRMAMPRILNVSRPVCMYCANNTSDVMLVQVLLNQACAGAPQGGPFGWAHGLRRLVPDGRFGSITESWIRGLQNDPTYGLRGGGDGRVDPASGDRDTTITEAPYTIYLLNVYASQRDRSFIGNLHMNHAVPAYLRRHIIAAKEAADV